MPNTRRNPSISAFLNPISAENPVPQRASSNRLPSPERLYIERHLGDISTLDVNEMLTPDYLEEERIRRQPGRSLVVDSPTNVLGDIFSQPDTSINANIPRIFTADKTIAGHEMKHNNNNMQSPSSHHTGSISPSPVGKTRGRISARDQKLIDDAYEELEETKIRILKDLASRIRFSEERIENCWKKKDSQTRSKNMWNLYQSFFQDPGPNGEFTNREKERLRVGNSNATAAECFRTFSDTYTNWEDILITHNDIKWSENMAASTIGQRARMFKMFTKKLDDLMAKASSVRFEGFWTLVGTCTFEDTGLAHASESSGAKGVINFLNYSENTMLGQIKNFAERHIADEIRELHLHKISAAEGDITDSEPVMGTGDLPLEDQNKDLDTYKSHRVAELGKETILPPVTPNSRKTAPPVSKGKKDEGVISRKFDIGRDLMNDLFERFLGPSISKQNGRLMWQWIPRRTAEASLQLFDWPSGVMFPGQNIEGHTNRGIKNIGGPGIDRLIAAFKSKHPPYLKRYNAGSVEDLIKGLVPVILEIAPEVDSVHKYGQVFFATGKIERSENYGMRRKTQGSEKAPNVPKNQPKAAAMPTIPESVFEELNVTRKGSDNHSDTPRQLLPLSSHPIPKLSLFQNDPIENYESPSQRQANVMKVSALTSSQPTSQQHEQMPDLSYPQKVAQTYAASNISEVPELRNTAVSVPAASVSLNKDHYQQLPSQAVFDTNAASYRNTQHPETEMLYREPPRAEIPTEAETEQVEPAVQDLGIKESDIAGDVYVSTSEGAETGKTEVVGIAEAEAQAIENLASETVAERRTGSIPRLNLEGNQSFPLAATFKRRQRSEMYRNMELPTSHEMMEREDQVFPYAMPDYHEPGLGEQSMSAKRSSHAASLDPSPYPHPSKRPRTPLWNFPHAPSLPSLNPSQAYWYNGGPDLSMSENFNSEPSGIPYPSSEYPLSLPQNHSLFYSTRSARNGRSMGFQEMPMPSDSDGLSEVARDADSPMPYHFSPQLSSHIMPPYQGRPNSTLYYRTAGVAQPRPQAPSVAMSQASLFQPVSSSHYPIQQSGAYASSQNFRRGPMFHNKQGYKRPDSQAGPSGGI